MGSLYFAVCFELEGVRGEDVLVEVVHLVLADYYAAEGLFQGLARYADVLDWDYVAMVGLETLDGLPDVLGYFLV